MTADSKELEDVWRCVTGVALGNHLERDIFELYRGLGPEIAAFKADLRLLLSTNEALARENERRVNVLKKLRDGDYTWPTGVSWQDCVADIARQALEPSHDQTGAKG